MVRGGVCLAARDAVDLQFVPSTALAIIDSTTQAACMMTNRDTDFMYGGTTDGTAFVIDSNPDIDISALGDINAGLNPASGLAIRTDSTCYGQAVFEFDNPLTTKEMASIASWCNYQWRNNNKVLPPWLKNRQ